MGRLDRDQMFFEIAATVAKRGTCPRAQVGAIIVRENRVISMGYNGAPPGMDHCEEVGCEYITLTVAPHGPEDPERVSGWAEGCDRSIHAEANAIAFAARQGVGTLSAEMYCTHGPCYACAKLMLSAGISVARYITPYRDERGHDLLVAGGCTVITHESC